MSSLSFEPLISPILWVTLAVPAVGLLVWYAMSRPAAATRGRWAVIIALMSLGMAAVLFVLLNPIWLEPIPPPPGKPLLTVLVDATQSMAMEDAEAGTNRFEAAQKIAGTLVEQMESEFEVRIRTFADSGRIIDRASKELAAQQPDGTRTDLASAIATSIEEDRPQGQAIVVLSDGGHNAPGGIERMLDVVKTAKAMAAPVYTKTLGGDAQLNDLEVALLRPQELSFIGQGVPVPVVVRQRGRVTDRADVVLTSQGKEIARQTAKLKADGITTVQLSVKEQNSGLYRYDIRIEPHKGETTAANNSTTLLLRVVETPIRLLVLEGKPYWDAKFLMRTLASDPSLELDSVVRLSSNRFLKRTLRVASRYENTEKKEKKEGEKSPPVRRVEETHMLTGVDAAMQEFQNLEDYQVIVLGRDAEVFLDASLLDRIRTWMSRDGGALLCYRGSPVAQVNEELGRLLPVRWTRSSEMRHRMKLTPRGEDLSWLGSPGGQSGNEIVSKLPSLATVAIPKEPKPLAVVLATAESQQGPPLVTYQSYGTGRAVSVEGAGMWRWAFLAPQYRQHDIAYVSLWQSLLRWLVSSVGLVPGQDMLLRMDKINYTSGQLPSGILLMRHEVDQDQIPRIELFHGDERIEGEITPIPHGDEPGVYRVSFDALPDGSYHAGIVGGESRNSSTNVAFDVRPDLGEQLDVATRPDLMRRIAEESGGAVIDADTESIPDQFQEQFSRTRPHQVRPVSAWDRWWVLVGVLALWSTAWGLRRFTGLI